MRLNHVVLATALALTMSNDLNVSAGNSDTTGAKSVQGEDEDGDSGGDTQKTSDLLASSDKKISSGDMSGGGELDDLLDMGGSDEFAALMKSLGGLGITGSTSGSEADMSASGSSGSAIDNDDSSTSDSSGSSEDESGSDEMSGGSELDDTLDMNGSDGFAALLKSLGSLGTTGSTGNLEVDDMSGLSGSLDTGNSDIMHVEEDDLVSGSSSSTTPHQAVVIGGNPSKKKQADTSASDSSSGDGSDTSDSFSSSEEESGSDDPSGSSEEESGSDDPSGSSEDESGSDDMSGGSELNDVLDMSGSDEFAALLKPLGGFGATEESSGISKTDDETEEAASAGGEMDMSALLSGLGGAGGGLAGLLNPAGPIAAAGSDVTDDDGSSGATPMPGANGTGRPSCDTWYRPLTSWIGNLYHKSSMNDCPTTRRLRAD